jgi:hypothetical protein
LWGLGLAFTGADETDLAGGSRGSGCPVLELPSEEGAVATKPITPRLADRLNRRLLAASQLQIQAARSVALDAGALGVMAVDFAAAAIFGARGAYDLGILALVLLGLSFGLAVQTLRLPTAGQLGPSVTDTPEAPESEDDHSPEDSLLNDLADDIEANAHAIARKETSSNGALTLLVLAILIDLAGRL